MFTIESLTVCYGKQTVLSDLDLSVASPSVFGLVGLNGSGKTTFLNALSGIVKSSAKRIDINGHTLDCSRLSYLETDSFFYPDITGSDYLGVFKRKHTDFQIDTWQKVFNLPLDKPVAQYSAGMKKKLALLGSLALDKELILLDEPYNSLDMESIQILQILLGRLKDIGKTVIVSSHILDLLTPVCDAIGILADGKIKHLYSNDEYAALKDYFQSYIDRKYGTLICNALPKRE